MKPRTSRNTKRYQQEYAEINKAKFERDVEVANSTLSKTDELVKYLTQHPEKIDRFENDINVDKTLIKPKPVVRKPVQKKQGTVVQQNKPAARSSESKLNVSTKTGSSNGSTQVKPKGGSNGETKPKGDPKPKSGSQSLPVKPKGGSTKTGSTSGSSNKGSSSSTGSKPKGGATSSGIGRYGPKDNYAREFSFLKPEDDKSDLQEYITDWQNENRNKVLPRKPKPDTKKPTSSAKNQGLQDRKADDVERDPQDNGNKQVIKTPKAGLATRLYFAKYGSVVDADRSKINDFLDKINDVSNLIERDGLIEGLKEAYDLYQNSKWKRAGNTNEGTGRMEPANKIKPRIPEKQPPVNNYPLAVDSTLINLDYESTDTLRQVFKTIKDPNRYSIQHNINLNGKTVGVRNYGEYPELRNVKGLVLPTFHPWIDVSKMNPEADVVGVTPSGRIISGLVKDMPKGTRATYPNWVKHTNGFLKDGNGNIVMTPDRGNAGAYQTVLQTTDGSNPQFNLMAYGNHDLFRGADGGAIYVETPYERRIIRGSINEIDRLLLALQANYPNTPLKVYAIADNGNNSKGLFTKNKTITENDWKVWDRQGYTQHGLYLYE